ncbi:MAG: hypothetical protein IJ837_03355 [Clostridia bacterium]|nr:hypothetical protein [Clostridia bacterium]
MYGIYYSEENEFINSNLKILLDKNDICLDYTNKINELLKKVLNFRPNLIFLQFKTKEFKKLFYDIFSKESMFYMPYVFIIDENSCKSQNGESLEEVLEKIKYPKMENINKNIPINILKNLNTLLVGMGFSAKNRGLIFLKDAIKYYVFSSTEKDITITKVLDYVSKIHKTNVENVERSIRVAINVAWAKIKPKEASAFSGVDEIYFLTKPTTKQFIIDISDILLSKA